MIPLMHDLKGKKVVIFGGGDVGLRKARYFLEECRVTVISMDFCEGFSDSDGNRGTCESETEGKSNCGTDSGCDRDCGLTLIKADLSAVTDEELTRHIADCTVCVAATSDIALNNRIRSICMNRGLMFDNAAGEPGNITVPSVVKGRNYKIAISTGGKSPATSRYMRRYFEKTAPKFDDIIELQCELRELLKSTVESQSERKRIIEATLEDEKVLRELKLGKDHAMEYIRKVYL